MQSITLLLRPNWVLSIALALLAMSLPLPHNAAAGNEIWQAKAYLPGMAAIATGVLAALLSATMRPQSRRWSAVLILLGCVGCGGIFFADDVIWRALHDGELLVLTLSTAALAIAFRWRELEQPARLLPGTRWLCRFGRLSYEIYLTHMFVVYALVARRRDVDRFRSPARRGETQRGHCAFPCPRCVLPRRANAAPTGQNHVAEALGRSAQ